MHSPDRTRTTSTSLPLRSLIALLLIGAVFLAVGGFLAWHSLRLELRTWLFFETVEATITESHVHSWPGRGDNASPNIRFSYEVGTTDYHDGRWRVYEVSEGTEDEIAALVALYRAGSKHPAWYDPADPSIAVLTRSFSVLSFISLALLVAAFAIPLWLRRLAPRSR